MKPVLLVLLFAVGFLYAQNDSALAKVSLKDGSEITGYVISETPDSILIHTLSEIDLKLPVTAIDKVQRGFYRLDGDRLRKNDQDASHFFLAPTARVMEGTQVRLGIYELFFPFLAVSFDSRVMISGGISLLPGAKEQVYYVAPKVNLIKSENINVAGGLMFFGVDNDNLAFVYGSGTLGTLGYAFTITLGYGYNGKNFSRTGLVILGGETQISENSKMIAEAWLITSEATLVSFGMRNFGFGGAIEFGFYTVLQAEKSGFPFIPWLGVNFNL